MIDDHKMPLNKLPFGTFSDAESRLLNVGKIMIDVTRKNTVKNLSN
jgi:hypothetical protein